MSAREPLPPLWAAAARRVVHERLDLQAGEAARDEGMDAAAQARAEILALGRSIARQHAKLHGTVTADDVHRRLLEMGVDAGALGNAAGSLFRGDGWVETGQWRPSARASNHAHRNRVWRLEG